MHNICRLLVIIFLLAPTATLAADENFYESKIRPLLSEHCYSCHSEQAKKLKGDLKLDSSAGWLRGGSSGPAVVPGKPDESPLIQAARRDHAEISAMPPDRPLSREQVALLVEWVKGGAIAPSEAGQPRVTETVAQARQRWPFTPIPSVIAVPMVQDSSWARSPIDHFIRAKQEAKSLRPVGDADRRELIRRVTYDLTGLPPTPDEVQAFVEDGSTNAWEIVIDRLLASPRYGERWGRHWMDVVRYADTAGDNSDFPIPQMALYRNWIIDAFNRDLPYDQFVQHQLAGDLISGGSEADRQQRIIATGYIANARRFGSTVPDYPWHLTIEDTLDNLGRAFLGLTLNCARCHDHKFDPVSMKDYYALYGIFNSTRYPWPGIELEQRQRDLVIFGPEKEVQAELARRERVYQAFEKQISDLEKAKKGKDKAEQAPIQKQIDELKGKLQEERKTPLPYPTAYAVAEKPQPVDVAVQLKGDPRKPAEVVRRRFLAVLGGAELPAHDTTSGRLALARWITSPENPLFARVMVNRVWHYHFGRGLVSTPNDFGKQGQPPTHPELLDYLARQFITSGYRLKALHKHILMSRVYQLASRGDVPGADTADPTNELLTRFRLRRLDAESLRDTLLAVSGNLNLDRPGPHPFPPEHTWKFTQHNPFREVYEHNHRSVYLMVQRIQRHPFLGNFDGADTGASTGSRVSSTTALQSLFFLNDPFVHDQARGLAQRLQREARDDNARIQRVYQLLFARPASPAEVERGLAYLRQARELIGDAAWESYTRAIFRLNELVYLD